MAEFWFWWSIAMALIIGGCVGSLFMQYRERRRRRTR